MGRLATLTINDLTETQKTKYLASPMPRGDKIRGPAAAWLRSPDMFEHLAAMIMFFRDRSVLGPRLCEFAILIVIAEWNASYPWALHARLAKDAGLAPDIIQALSARRAPDFQNEDERAVYAFSAELREKHAVSDATYQAALRHFGEQGVVELTALLGFYVLTCMTTNVLEMSPQD